ncbi:MAG: AAC(3) family N-acetyltransferase [Magnetococcales bacterium]|nr:AAC(3) family N-acetyltransferase [Magnetococcales bacterium]
MTLSVTDQEQMAAHIRACGVEVGADIIVHSTLLGFGVLQGGVEMVYRALRSVVGEGGTIAVPTYLLGADPNLIYDAATTPSLAVGSFSEYLRQLDGAVRSPCPLHSHAAVGPKAALLNEVDGGISLGRGSDFDILHDAGFATLMLGCPFKDGATFVMHLEAVAGVHFREWLDLRRKIRDPDGSVRSIRCRYYARKRGFDEDLQPILDLLQASGTIRTVPFRRTTSLYIPVVGYGVALEGLLKNPEMTLIK